MQVLSVKPVKGKTAKRYHVHIYLDSENMELDLPLYSNELYKYGIEEMKDLPDSLYETIVDQTLRTRIITRCEYLLNSKAYTKEELKSKLREGFYPEPLIDEAIETMQKYHFIDDEDYAIRYTELNGHKKSKRMVAIELKAKGISDTMIEEVTAELDSCQDEILDKLINKRCSGKNLSDSKEWIKQMRFLISKGFEYDEITRALGRYKELGDYGEEE